jgi:hypothetical protein
MRTLSLLGSAILVIACSTEVPCSERPHDTLCQDVDAAGHDAGPIDAGTSETGPGDAGGDAHVPCGGSCAGATPHCLAATETCVGCTAGTDCGGTTPICDTATHTCVGCAGPADCLASHRVCDTTSHTCVACLGDTDCGTTAAARCDVASHACVPCTASTNCAHETTTPVCGAGGACVQCTAADETACGANSCNPTTSTCTTTPRTTVATCHACVADSECMTAMDRCVPMQFMGASHGSYCLHPLSAGCARPFTVITSARASTSGAPAATYCGVDETVTTCEAVTALLTDTTCTVPADCGATGIDDGRCATVSGLAGRCTYSCAAAAQCPSGFTCGGGYCGS